MAGIAVPLVDKTPRLEVRRLFKSYGATQALAGVDLKLLPGEIHGLAGENGAGKSTFVKVVSGATAPDTGDVFVDGELQRFRGPRDAINSGVRVVHQELSIISHLSVAENLLLGDLPQRGGVLNRRAMRARAEQLLAPVGLSDIDVGIPIEQLSLGQQQLVEIARALREQPRALLLDEPSAILGPNDLDKLFLTLRRLAAAGASILFISHRLSEIFDLTQKVTVFRDGRHIGTFPTRDLDENALIHHMTGRKLKAPSRAEVGDTRRTGPVLRADNIRSTPRVKGASLQLFAGEIVCLTGLVGSGRTELARAIIGADSKSHGDVYINGDKVEISNPRVARNFGIGYLPENRKEAGLLLDRSIGENLGLASLSTRARFGVVDRRRDKRTAAELVKRIDIRCRSAEQLVSELSGGNQQKVLIARWLVTEPQVLLLDEPTRGVDVGGKSEIYNVVRNLSDSGVAVLIISSEIEEVLLIADRVLVMREGRISGIFAGTDITESNVMQAAFRDLVPVGE